MTINIDEVPVENWPVEDLKPYPYNHKKHPPKQIEMLAASIDRHGHLDPIAIDEDGVIISGHGRLEAIKKLGRARVNVRVLRGLSEEQKSALRIAANKTVSNEYDTDALQRELSKLVDTDFSLDGLGLEQKELDMLLADVGVIDQDTIVQDIDVAVEAHEAGVADTAAQVDQDRVRLDRAFGFKDIPLRDQKAVTRFMSQVEASTGLTGAEALIAHMRSVVAAA